MSDIIEEYDLRFTLTIDSQHLKHAYLSSNTNTLLDYHISGYFIGQSVPFLLHEVLVEIDNALNGRPFDTDAGGTLSFLTIGESKSVFSALNAMVLNVTIPTKDLKEIITVWTAWLIQNDLVNYTI